MKGVLAVLWLGLAHAGNILEELEGAGASSLLDLLGAAGLNSTLAGEGPFTLFAPSNDAFAKLPVEMVDSLTADTAVLQQVLLHHVVAGSVASGNLSNDVTMETVEGSEIRTNIYLQSDYYDGFITINGKRIKTADIEATNGIIHIITDVIYPMVSNTSIADIIATDPRFSTLQAAVNLAELTETVGGEGALTVFAPTNAAFEKVPSSTLTALLTDKEALTALLLRHVAPGSIFQKGICWDILPTAGGEEVATQVFKGGVVKVVSYSAGVRAGAIVQDFDILATNGVIHAIDTVI